MAKRGPSAVNVLLAVEKPLGITSHDAVSRVRRAVGERRVGHAGTLDPAASGVLVIGIGQATKLLGMLTLDRKSYRATIQLGAQTATDDAEGEVIKTSEVPSELLRVDNASRIVAGLVGEVDQVPPAYSAISVGGRRAYAMARSGEEVELAARRICVHAAELVSVDAEKRQWVVDLDVSKGTYIRSIARDLGAELGCLAHLAGLVRTSAGPVCLEECLSLDELADGGAELARAHALDPVAALGLPIRELALSEVADVSCGRRIELGSAEGLAQAGRCALVFNGGLVGIWERRGRSLVCQTNFPQAVEGVVS